jgi:putative copper resistance protein D
MALLTAQQLATVVLNLSVALAVGAGMSAAWLRRPASLWALGQLRCFLVPPLAGLASALLADIAVLWLEAAAMAEVPVGAAAAPAYAMLSATHFGACWLTGFGALVAAGAAAIARSGAARWCGLLALAGFLYSRSIVSHAGAEGDFSWPAAADWLHLVLISVWVGEVLVAGAGTLRRAASVHVDRLEQARYVEALSHSATLALAGIAASGLYAAWRALGSLDKLSGNPYAGVLLVKLSLVAGAALLGGANRLLVMPGLLAGLRGSGAAPAARRFALVLQVEALVLVAVLVAAAVLSSTAPPTAT